MKRVKSNKNFKINFRKVLLTLIAALFTSVGLSLLIIAFPQTERLYGKVRYDLTFEKPFWRKEYVLDIDIKPEDYNERGQKLDETKRIIHKRLRDYGVQKVSFTDNKIDDKKKARITVKVETDRDQTTVDRLIGQRYYIRFVTRKKDVNFDDAKNQFAIYDPANYEPTDYTRYDFRTIYITKLKASTGEFSYFGIYKPWENKSGEFYKFMDKYAGQYAGIEIDGFVTPIVVPITTGQTQQGGIVTRQPFALGVGSDKGVAQSIDLLLNSGVVPLNYTQSSVKSLEMEKIDVDHVKTIVTLLGITIAITIIIIFAHIRLDLLNVGAYILSVATMITFAKLFSFPVQLVVLLYSMILATILMPLFISSFRTSGILLVTSLCVYMIRVGYIRDVAFYIMILIALFIFYERAVKIYASLINRILR